MTVKVAFFVDNLAAIAEGLENVESVVTDGAAYLSERSKVAITAEPTAPGTVAPESLPAVTVPTGATSTAAKAAPPASAPAAAKAVAGDGGKQP